MSEAKPEPPASPAPQPPNKRSSHARRPADTTEKNWIFPAVMIAILVVGGWFLIQNLSATSKMEDCQMAGRKNCLDPIDTSNMR